MARVAGTRGCGRSGVEAASHLAPNLGCGHCGQRNSVNVLAKRRQRSALVYFWSLEAF